MLQTVELAKLKCTVTMGTLGEKEEKKRLTMKYRKGQRQYVLLKITYYVCLDYLKLHCNKKQSNQKINFNNPVPVTKSELKMNIFIVMTT